MSTNTFRYTTCCTANVYMFVYILTGAPIVPLKDIITSLSKHLKEKQFSSQIILTRSSAREDNFVLDIH